MARRWFGGAFVFLASGFLAFNLGGSVGLALDGSVFILNADRYDPNAFRTAQPESTWSGEERHFNPGEVPEVMVSNWIEEFGIHGEAEKAYYHLGITNYGNVFELELEGNPASVSILEGPIFLAATLGTAAGLRTSVGYYQVIRGGLAKVAVKVTQREAAGGVRSLLGGPLEDILGVVQREFAKEMVEGAQIMVAGSYARGAARVPRAIYQRLPKKIRGQLPKRPHDLDVVVLVPEHIPAEESVLLWGRGSELGVKLRTMLQRQYPNRHIPEIDIMVRRNTPEVFESIFPGVGRAVEGADYFELDSFLQVALSH